MNLRAAHLNKGLCIAYSKEHFERIKKFFPDLEYDPKHETIQGNLYFRVKYFRESTKSPWRIGPLKPGEDANKLRHLVDDKPPGYKIKIRLGNNEDARDQWGFPMVFEKSGRIEKTRKRLGKELRDVHLNKLNGICWCCLAFHTDIDADNLYDYVKDYVYPYFVFQAYYEKYSREPPSGSRPHDPAQAMKQVESDRKKKAKRSKCNN